MKDLVRQAVEKIKQQQLQPISKNVFVTKRFFWWFGFCLAIALGGASLSIAIFLVSELDWDIYRHAGHSLAEFLLISLPHLWLIFIILFGYISYQNIRRTKSGYKYKNLTILGIILAGSVVLGVTFDVLGFAGSLNNVFVEKIPGYNAVVQTKEKQWSRPEDGLLSGQIVNELDQNEFILQDFNGQKWQINLDSNTIIKRETSLQANEKIKIIGAQENGNNVFDAEEIRPWEGRGKMRTEKSQSEVKDNRRSQGQRKGK